jgi:hypothetical protein
MKKLLHKKYNFGGEYQASETRMYILRSADLLTIPRKIWECRKGTFVFIGIFRNAADFHIFMVMPPSSYNTV